MVIPSFEKSQVFGVTVMQNRIVAFSLNPELSHAVRWENHLSYCIRRFLQLNTSTFWRNGGMQDILESLLYREAKTPWATDWLWLVQLSTKCFLQNSAFAWNVRELPSQAELALSVLPSHWTKVYRVWADFPFLYTPSWSIGVPMTFPHWHGRAELFCTVSCCTITKSKC